MNTIRDHHDETINKATEILTFWGLSRDAAILILGKQRYTLEVIKKRALLVHDISSSLKILFENPKNVQAFMRMPNHNAYFNGKTPLDMISDGELSSLEECAQRIKCLSLAPL